ncbi:hypothetical protein [Bryobacter aggregatus]|uniref:hypothetical protein n=1 Tax=Bryobacter aggregatus TaxID=360054 RepID=UPI0004E1388B|nr:hypothetical protein [Bryobacter aggregatus]
MKDKKMEGLLAALRREGNPETAPETEVPSLPAPPPRAKKPEAPAKTEKRGAAVQFWLRDEDRQVIRELSAYLAAQGRRSTDSLVIRAALHLAKADANLIRAFEQAQSLDGRRRSKTP